MNENPHGSGESGKYTAWILAENGVRAVVIEHSSRYRPTL